ncbi:MAG TPA: hypothetical protein VMM18_17090 [Gemmatimonadaceae bacterium]|nr:hypothetical protein [Gemmatimonadaceae bacterium]
MRAGQFRPVVAVVGPGDDASESAVADAESVGRLLADNGWITLCGGVDAGVMAAAARGASAGGGLSIGLLPGFDRAAAAPELTGALPTGLGQARNAVLVTAADAVVGCGLNPGTLSELALALRAGKPTVLVHPREDAAALLASLAAAAPFYAAPTPGEAVAWLERHLGQQPRDG